MFGEKVYYFSQIRKMIVCFGTIFNDIHIQRTDQNKNVTSIIKVPLAFASKDKLLVRVDQDPDIDRPYSQLFPRMGFELVNLKYRGQDKISSLNKVSFVDTTNNSTQKSIYTPVPYNFEFKLHIAAKNIEDGMKILEQILPFFTPDWTPKVELIPEMNIIHDIPIILNSMSQEDKYDGKMEQRQVITYTLNFTMKGFIYGPIKDIPVIKQVNINFRLPDVNDIDIISSVGKTPIGEELQIQVAELANNTPTTNVAASIPLSQINANSNYGIATTIITNDELNTNTTFVVNYGVLYTQSYNFNKSYDSLYIPLV